jgi:hypothetical protein
MWTMPKVEIDYTVNIGSIINAGLLLLGIMGGALAYFSDQRIESETVRALKDRVQQLQQADQQITSKITEAQINTTNRLSTLEAQNTFIINSLNRLESTLRGKL